MCKIIIFKIIVSYIQVLLHIMSIPLLKVKYKICFTFSFEIVQTKSLFGIFNIDFCSRFRILLEKLLKILTAREKRIFVIIKHK